METDVKATQLTVSGQVTTERSFFRKLIIHHTGGGDAELKFYDLNAFPIYGKQIQQSDMPDPGVLFVNGIYVTVPADCTCTVLYSEA
jgi:hypothetical protein